MAAIVRQFAIHLLTFVIITKESEFLINSLSNPRTKQEEQREWPDQEKSSLSLSTYTCIYIQATLVLCLLIVALVR